jgi:hypothetical protein
MAGHLRSHSHKLVEKRTQREVGERSMSGAWQTTAATTCESPMHQNVSEIDRLRCFALWITAPIGIVDDQPAENALFPAPDIRILATVAIFSMALGRSLAAVVCHAPDMLLFPHLPLCSFLDQFVTLRPKMAGHAHVPVVTATSTATTTSKSWLNARCRRHWQPLDWAAR